MKNREIYKSVDINYNDINNSGLTIYIEKYRRMSSKKVSKVF